MSGFIQWLERLNEKDTRIRAVLRRSLAFDPGTYPSAFPYVEPFLRIQDSGWKRQVHYLVAGLWAQHWREGRRAGTGIGTAAATHMKETGSSSIEARFIALLDADEDQLPYRLRQMISLLRNEDIDFDGMLTGLLSWTSDQRRTQTDWARDFYHLHHNENQHSEEDQP